MTAIWILSAVLAFFAGYDASRTHCQVCHRRFALFTVVGRRLRPTVVCWRCRRTHHRLARNRR